MLLPVTSRTRVRRSGISPLHLAAERNNDEVLEALLSARFDVNAPLAPERARLYEDRRSSALYFAVVNNNVYATELLLLAGADPNRDVINPLLVAIRHGCLRTMQLLLDHGANIDAYIATHPTAFPATIMFSMKCLSLLKFIMDLGCNGEPCFSCLYGNGPHPPAPSPSNRFNDAPASNKAPGVVQVGRRVWGRAARASALRRLRGLVVHSLPRLCAPEAGWNTLERQQKMVASRIWRQCGLMVSALWRECKLVFSALRRQRNPVLACFSGSRT